MKKILAYTLIFVLLFTTIDITALAQEYIPAGITENRTLKQMYTSERDADSHRADARDSSEYIPRESSVSTCDGDDIGMDYEIPFTIGSFDGMDVGIMSETTTDLPVISTLSQLMEQFPYSISGTTCTITINQDFDLVYRLYFSATTINSVTLDNYILIPEGIRTINFSNKRIDGYPELIIEKGITVSFGTKDMGTANQFIFDGGGNIQYENGEFVNKGIDHIFTGIYNHGTLTIHDGVTIQNFCSHENAIISNYASMTIEDCTLIHNWPDCDFGGNTFTDGMCGLIANIDRYEDTGSHAILTIQDILIYDNLTAASAIGNHCGTVTLHNGEITSAKSDFYKKWFDTRMFDEGIENSSGTFTLKSGSITGYWDNVYVNGTKDSYGKFHLEGGTLSGYGYEGEPYQTSTDTCINMQCYSDVTISGGTISKVVRGAVCYDNSILKVNGGTIDIDRGNSGVLLGGICNVTFSGGTIKNTFWGITSAIDSSGASVLMKENAKIESCLMQGILIEPGNTFQMDGGIIDSCGSEECFGNTEYNMLYGGGINSAGECIINGGIIQNCIAQSGGGIYNAGRQFEFIYDDGGTLTINGGIIQNNSVPADYGSGGGVCNEGALFTLTGGTIRNNTAFAGAGVTNGGGVYYSSNATMVMTGGTICDNNALDNGAGLYNQTIATLSGGTISNNTAPVLAAISDYYGSTTISDTFVIKDNVNTDSEYGDTLPAPRVTEHRIVFDVSEEAGGNLKIYETYNNPIVKVTPYELDMKTSEFHPIEGIVVEKVSDDNYLIKITDSSLVPVGETVEKYLVLDIITQHTRYEPGFDCILYVKMTNLGPKVSLKQASKINVFYTNSTSDFTISTTKGEISDITINEKETDNFTCTYDPLTNKGTILQKDNIPLKKDGSVNTSKLDKTISITVHFAERYQPMNLNIKVSVINKAPSMAFTPSSITIYPTWNNTYSDVSLYNKTTQTTDTSTAYSDILSKTAGISLTPNSDGTFRIQYDGKKTKKLKVQLKRENWRKSMTLSISVKVAKPKATLSAKTITLNTNQIGEASPYPITSSLTGNTAFKLTTALVEGSNKLAKNALENGTLQIETCEDGSLKANLQTVDGLIMKNGSYKLKVTPQIKTTDGIHALKAVTLTIKVTNKQPSITFSGKAKIKLSKPENISYSTYKTKVKNVTANVTDIKLIDGNSLNFTVTYLGEGKFYITAKDIGLLEKNKKYTIPLEIWLDNGTKVIQSVKIKVVK